MQAETPSGSGPCKGPVLRAYARLVCTVAVASAVVVAAAGCGERGPALARGRVIIETAPEDGAEVVIHGRSFGTTPAIVEGLRPGHVLVQLTKDRWKTRWEMVEIPEEGEQRFVYELEPQVGFLTIESVPSLAEVFLDGGRKPVGETPFVRRPVPIGRHMYELRMKDYETLRRVLKIEADYRYTFHHKLRPKMARLEVYSSPTAARVWLNDEVQMRLTPAAFGVVPGTYRVGVHTNGHIMAEKVVKLGPNQVEVVDLKMEEGNAPPGMVFVPAGEFTLGTNGAAPDEAPEQKVNLDAFYIDRYEVTNRQFATVVPTHEYEEGRDNFPVAGVTYHEAVAYAEAVDKRLPTEYEWEKAARGPSGRLYPWGDDFDGDLCNTSEELVGAIEEVGQRRGGSSVYGCYDMAGNVYEWTMSWYSSYPGNKKILKEYGQIFRVLRGGSYRSGRFEVRGAARHFDRMDKARGDYGFRCVKDVEAQPGD